jgi:hypothetical protein
LTNIKQEIERLREFQETIKKELVTIEDWGIAEKGEVEEAGLVKRGKVIEEPYGNVRKYLIGEEGLIPRLIEDCIKQLGSPLCEYMIFGSGRLRLVL